MPPPPAPEGPADRKRRQVVERLPEGCRADFNRLCKTLLHGPAFQWLLVDAPQEALRRQVMDALNEVLSAARLRVNRLPLGSGVADVAALEARLIKNAVQADVVHVIGSAGWFTAERWDGFNVRRERLAQGARARLVFWLDGDAIALASQGAPDLWAWRSGVYAFANAARPAMPARGSAPVSAAAEARSKAPEVPMGASTAALRAQEQAERTRRLAEIDAWLQAHPGLDDELLISPTEERAQLLTALGRGDEALQQWQAVVLPAHQRRGDAHRAALARQAMAALLAARGDSAAALALLRDEVVPALEQVGAVTDLADAQDALAVVLEQSGELDAALALRLHELQPLLLRLGAAWQQATNQDQIGQLLYQLGRDEEALAAWEVAEALYSRLGDAAGETWAASVLEASAQVLQARGELDLALGRLQRALTIYRRHHQELPALWCLARIAGTLRRRGQAAEADRMMAEVRASAQRLGLDAADFSDA